MNRHLDHPGHHSIIFPFEFPDKTVLIEFKFNPIAGRSLFDFSR